MKNLLLLLLFIGIELVSQSQNTEYLYFNNEWKNSNAEDAHYIRKIVYLPTEKGKIINFTDSINNSYVIARGNYINNLKQGEFTFYFPNGNISKKMNFDKNILVGDIIIYYENGSSKSRMQFKDGDFKIKNYNDESGNSLLDKDSTYWEHSLTYSPVGNEYTISGYLIKRKKFGEWTCKINDTIIYSDFYKKDKYLYSKNYTNNQKVYYRYISPDLFLPLYIDYIEYNYMSFLSDNSSEIYYGEVKSTGINKDGEIVIVDTNASYLGGTKSIYATLAKSIRTTNSVQKLKKKLTVYVEIYIDENGNPFKYNILRGSEFDDINEEALRVAKLLLAWRPAYSKGEPIVSKVIFPFSFQNSSND